MELLTKNYLMPLLTEMDNEREPFHRLWQQVDKLINEVSTLCIVRPTETVPVNYSNGLIRKNNLRENAGNLYSKRLASGLQAYITNRGIKWLQMTSQFTKLDNQDVLHEDTLFKLTEAVSTTLRLSNFYAETPCIYKNIGDYGTACQMIKPIKDGSKRLFELHEFPIGTFWIRQTAAKMVDVCAGVKVMPKWKAYLSMGVEKECRNPLEMTMLFLIAFKDHEQLFDVSGTGNTIFCKFIQSSEVPELKVERLTYFPFLVPRWSVSDSKIAYSTQCPGLDAVNSITRSSGMSEDIAYAIKQKVMPAMIVNADMEKDIVNSGLLPGSFTYNRYSAAKNEAVKRAIDINFQVAEVSPERNLQLDAVKKHYGGDLFTQFIDGDTTRKSAQEIVERKAEKIVLMSPVNERLEPDLFTPLIEYVVQRLAEEDNEDFSPALPNEYKVYPEFKTLLSRSMSELEVESYQRFLEMLSPLLQARFPTEDAVHYQEIIQKIAFALNIAPTVVKTDLEYMQKQKERMDIQKMQAQGKTEKDMATADKEQAQAQQINQESEGGF